ncbi:SCO7613 C-terminal domain-containing membrane protein [Actinoplanes palleronii]|uniref:Permease n=1 Tax=Actinoplanes palleronii TaxID=113570 RepID=A0ABQ4BI41_9ACTN|nr:hypothetical protein [Actinoplanes palleronii]GIE70357.1 hypothetical protein Apa02nite_064650 [Actinoplanes palleronii]
MSETVPVTEYPCPHCESMASAETGCPDCGRGPDPDAIEVVRLDAEIIELRTRLQAIRAEAAGVETQLRNASTQRDAAAFRVRSALEPVAPVLAPPAWFTGTGTTPPPPPPTIPAPPRLPSEPAPERRLTTLTAQNVLFALGGLLLVVAAAVFTAVAWAQVGVAGRALILAAATAAVLAVPPFAQRRGLTGAAETLAAVGLLMILMDGYAAWAVDLLGVTNLAAQVYAAAVCAVTAVIALGYGRLVGLPGPRIAALLIAQPVLPLIAAGADADTTGWSLALTGVTALNLVILHRGRFAPVGTGLLAYACGSIAAFCSAIVALGGVRDAGTPGQAAVAGCALILIAAVLTAGTVLAANREAQMYAAAGLTVAIGVAAGGVVVLLNPGTPTLRLAVLALIITVPAAVARVRLPEPVGRGPWFGALGLAAVPALAVAAAALTAARSSLEAARPVLDAPLGWVVTGSTWDLPVAAVAVVLAYGILLPGRHRADLALTALLAVALLVPAAFRLPWWTAAGLGVIVTAVAVALATRATSVRRLGFRLGVSAVATAQALATGLGDPGVAAGVCAAITLIGVTAATLVRSGPRHGDAGVAAATAGLLAGPAAVWLGLLAADTSGTVRVRALFLVTLLLCAAAHRLAWYVPQVTGVALLIAGGTPLWALAGSDPGALYVAGALLLVAVLRRPYALVAGVMLVIGLLGWTGPDLAVVLIEPFDGPVTGAVGWSAPVAVLITAVAAAVATRDPATMTTIAANKAHKPGSAIATVARLGPVTAALLVASPLVALAVPLTLAAAGAPWPVVPLATLVTGLAGLAALTVTAATPPGFLIPFGVLAIVGLTGSTHRPGATLTAFALVTVAGAVIGTAARDEPARITGWLAATLSTVVVAYTAADLAALDAGGTALAVLAAAAAAAVLDWFLAARRPREALAAAAVAHGTALIALLISGSTGRAALIATLWSVVLAVRALRPGEPAAIRNQHVIAAAGSALLGWWLFLTAQQVTTAEVYTAPAAVLALGAGWFVRRGRPELPSWAAYGPALGAAFLPTLAVIAGSSPDDPQYLRRLLLGVAALAVLVAGALARLQAPVVSGGVVLALVALHELAQVWDLVPRWVPLALGGLVLVGVATTLEQRRRDLARLREAVSRLG